MKRRIGIGLGIAAALVGTIALVTRGSSAHVDPVAAGRSPSVALSVASSTRPVLELGVEHQYAATLAQTVTLDAENRVPFVIGIDGTWAVAYAGETEHGNLFRAQLRDAKPSVKRNGVDASATLGDVTRPFFFTTTTEGRLISLSFAPGIEDGARSALATLAATFQISSRGGASWDAVESDSIGDYQARYSRGDTGIHRARTSYQRVTGEGALSATIVKSGTDVRARADGWADVLDGHEITRVGTEQLGVLVEAKFALRHTGTARIDPGAPDRMVTMAVDAAAQTARSSEQEDRAMVDGATLADLIASLASITDEHARGYTFLRIAALMRLEPAAVGEAQRMLGTATPELAGMLIGAMGEAGTPVAQHALAEVVNTPALAENTRTHAVVTLGLTAEPTRDTLRVLDETARTTGDLANTATLAQGNAALRMRDDDSGAASEQVDALLARLARATDDDERMVVLRALGNTGDARILDAVARAITSANVGVRVAATEALRLVRGTAADQLVLARLSDGSELVRSAAVFATVERDIAPFATALARVVRKDPDVGVRRAVVDLAAARLDELRSIVEQVAANDPDADLRAVAKAVLAT